MLKFLPLNLEMVIICPWLALGIEMQRISHECKFRYTFSYYIADYSGPIKVIGNIFSPGNYTVSLEVTGVDFDNLFLPTPLKFEFPVSIFS